MAGWLYSFAFSTIFTAIVFFLSFNGAEASPYGRLKRYFRPDIAIYIWFIFVLIVTWLLKLSLNHVR